VFRDGLPSHIQPTTELPQGPAVLIAQPVEKFPAASVRECLKNRIIVHLQ